MDTIEKALAKLTAKERERVKRIFTALRRGETHGLNIKKLKGRDDVFRVRKGNHRIIYRIGDGDDGGGGIFLLGIQRRKEDTYRLNV
ncbi:MAG: hypothetical protein AAB533_02460 [Patescibacteria group bacterium]